MHFQFLKAGYWKGQRLLLLTFLLLHTIASFYYISQQNITYDEPDYIEYAKRWLHGHPERIQSLDDSKSPIIAICWIPRIVRQLVNPTYHLNDYGRQDQREGRYLMILFSFMTAIYVYRWCRELYGAKGWQLPLLLLLFDPLYLSYTTLITSDLACGAFLIATLFHFRRYLLFGSQRHFYYTAILFTLGAVTKQSLLFVAVLLPLLSFLYHSLHGKFRQISKTKIAVHTFIFIAVFIIGINTFYYFHSTFIPLGNYVFESNSFQHLQQAFSLFSWLPVPLPQSYIQSLDMLQAHAEIGAGKPASTFNGVYLFGELKLYGGYWYYYLIVLFYKLPIGTMLLMLSCIPLLLARFRTLSFAKHYMFLIVPIIFYWIILSFFNQFQSGVRHILLLFPLMFIGLGYLFRQLAQAKMIWKLSAAAAIAYTFVTVAIFFPYIIPYTNEFITSKKTVYKKIYDSSVDYGQSDSAVRGFIKLHPEYRAATSIPSEGKYAVLMGEMLNTYLRNTSRYKWYMAFEPTSHYRYTVLLFHISKQDIDRADFTRTNFRIKPK